MVQVGAAVTRPWGAQTTTKASKNKENTILFNTFQITIKFFQYFFLLSGTGGNDDSVTTTTWWDIWTVPSQTTRRQR